MMKIANVRNISSLQTRFKKVLKAVKIHSAWQTANNRATGGGPPTAAPNTDGIKVEGVLLALKDYYGVAVTGFDPQDNDSDPLLPPINFESIEPSSTIRGMLDSEKTTDEGANDEEYSDCESVATTSSTQTPIATSATPTATLSSITTVIRHHRQMQW